MSRVFVQDRQTYKVTSREITPEGYLIAPGRAAKTGVQQYLRKELELKDGNPNDIVNVYRPPEEVFKQSYLDSFNGAVITYLHPKKLVDSDSYQAVTKGNINSPGVQDGDFVKVNLVIQDKATIKRVENGDAELSTGYTAEYHPEPGVTADGVAYEYVQRDMRVNHVAVLPVNSARAGRQARIFDNQPKGNTMKVVVLDAGRKVEIQDEAVATLVEDSISRLQTALDAANKAKDEAEAKAEKAEAKADMKEEEAEKAKKDTSDAAITARIAEIVSVKDRAAVIDSAYVADGVDTLAIMRGVLTAVRPNMAWADKSADYVQAAFDMAHESAKEGKSVKNAAQLSKMTADGVAQATKVQTSDAYAEYCKRMQSNERKGA